MTEPTTGPLAPISETPELDVPPLSEPDDSESGRIRIHTSWTVGRFVPGGGLPDVTPEPIGVRRAVADRIAASAAAYGIDLFEINPDGESEPYELKES